MRQPFRLTILGCYAATPRTLSNPTAQFLEMGGHHILIDCGEGTQVQLRKHKLSFGKINHIFISHLHGDHCYGLIGLVSTFMLFNRPQDLHIYGPTGIKELILTQLRLSGAYTPYGLYFHEMSQADKQVVFEDARLCVTAFPLVHRVLTFGYRFDEKPGLPHLNRAEADRLGVPTYCFDRLKRGEAVALDNGTWIQPEQVTFPSGPTRSYAYCSDTQFHMPLVEYIQGVDVLYHEATFLSTESDKAEKTQHSTAAQAAQIAQAAQVGTLVLGHYSTRYGSIEPFYTEASAYFSEVKLADDGLQFTF